jgi:hypothetical protein
VPPELACSKKSEPLLVMVALLVKLPLPGPLLPTKVSVELLMMVVLRAVLLPTKFSVELLVMVTLPPLMTMPAPLNWRDCGEGMVKVYAPELNVQPPTAVAAENDMLGPFVAPNVAVPVGPGISVVQFELELYSWLWGPQLGIPGCLALEQTTRCALPQSEQ